MNIPDFNHNHVLPPHKGNPVSDYDLSPYKCSSLELCLKFSTSPKRTQILKGLLAFRKRLSEVGIINGFQWLDGSFLENIEISEARDPNDLDLVTFHNSIEQEELSTIKAVFPEFASPSLSKTNFLLDHYSVDLMFQPEVIVEYTRYWLQLFSHNRNGVWKGMLQIQLNTVEEDQQAFEFLNKLPV